MRRCAVFWVVALSTSLLGFASHAKEPVGKGRTPAGAKQPKGKVEGAHAKQAASNKKTVAKKKRPKNHAKDDSSEEWTEEDEKEWQELARTAARARAGLPTDFDGDGFEEYLQWTDEKGVLHIEIKYSSGNLNSVSEEHPGGTTITSYYADGNKNPYQRIDRKPGSQVYLIDTDRDGVFDKRVSNTFDFAKNENHRVFEKINPDGSTREITLQRTEPISRGTPLSFLGLEATPETSVPEPKAEPKTENRSRAP